MSDEPAHVAQVSTIKNGGRSKKFFAVGCLIGLVLIACLGLVVAILATAMMTGVDNQDEWLALRDEFMQAMAYKELDQAHSLFTEEFSNKFRLADLAAFIDGPF